MRLIHGVTAGVAERATMDLTVRERLVVQRLGLEGDKAIAALGQSLGITASSMTSLVDRLEQKGHLRRVAHATDRRATLLSLTPKGRAAFARELDFYGALIGEALAPLGQQATAQVLRALMMLDAIDTKTNAA
jgi:DNA-binding MarR family transcriptional regulator